MVVSLSFLTSERFGVKFYDSSKSQMQNFKAKAQMTTIWLD